MLRERAREASMLESLPRIVLLWKEKRFVVMRKRVTGILRRFLKWVSVSLSGAVGIVVVAMCLLYVPAVQDVVRGKVERGLAKSMGMDVAVGRVSLRFPLDVAVEKVFVGDSVRGDTLAAAGEVRVSVGGGRGLRGVVRV